MKRVMVFFLMAAVMAKADLTPSITVCDNPSAQLTPAIDGGLAAWADERNGTGNTDIYAKVLPGGSEQEICTVLGNQTNPAVSGSVIVWQDSRKGGGNDDIYAYNISTGKILEVCIDNCNQQNPDISGSRVVWQEYNGSNWDIYGINLDGGPKFAVCADPGDQQSPAVSGHYVVWMDNRNYAVSGYDIYAVDLDNLAEGEFHICTVAGDQDTPDIDGDIIVWQDPRNSATSNTDIYGYNLGGSGEFPVCADDEKQSQPTVAGNRIVWRDRRNNSTTGYDIYGYDIKTGTIEPEPICTVEGHQNTPAVSAQYVVWQGPANAGDIYGAAFPVVASITVRSPNGGETYVAGSQQSILWQTEGEVAAVKIDLSANNGTSWQTIANNLANTGDYDAVIPADIHSQQCLLRISDTANPATSDQCDAIFTVFQCSLTADMTGDCFVGLDDFAEFAEQWLVCGNPFDSTWCQNN